MARVHLSGDLARRVAGGDVEMIVTAGDVRSVVRAVEKKYPGFSEIYDSGVVAVAIDGVIHQEALFESVGPDAEVYFMPAIRGG